MAKLKVKKLGSKTETRKNKKEKVGLLNSKIKNEIESEHKSELLAKDIHSGIDKKTSLQSERNLNKKIEKKRKRSSEDNADESKDEAACPTLSKKKKTDNFADEGFGVFVSSIPVTTKKFEVMRAFEKFGVISTVVLPMAQKEKNASQKNRGFAIVKFRAKEAVRAALACKKHEIKGEQVLVRKDKKHKPEKEKSSEAFRCTVYVANIKKGMPCEDLKKYFSQFGHVCNVVVCPSNNKISKPYAQVVFNSPEAKTLTLAQPSHKIGSLTVKVGTNRAAALGAEVLNNIHGENEIFVGQLSEQTTARVLHQHFSKYGKVTRVFQPRCPKTNRPKQVAFITFEKKESMQAALTEDHEIDHQALLVRDSKVDHRHKDYTPPVDADGKFMHAIFVARVPPNTDSQRLEEHFSQDGEVGAVKLKWDHNKKRYHSYGLVFFTSERGVRAALSREHVIDGRTLFVKRNWDTPADGKSSMVSRPGTNKAPNHHLNEDDNDDDQGQDDGDDDHDEDDQDDSDDQGQDEDGDGDEDDSDDQGQDDGDDDLDDSDNQSQDEDGDGDENDSDDQGQDDGDDDQDDSDDRDKEDDASDQDDVDDNAQDEESDDDL
ncbi:uncharacterized protein LOC108666462 isoform X3 [Hyalella azteca]|uniref:Uncharacterized protein LOC108666462 isoform X2 n=1 Tax=Hyalella azteca TaxID=294128 RepID=A0A8B7N4P6_HYAAZ|nr:uncharacterized protein LOC108666462 isoform X2 [Hyalella azteca]XP_047737011.1 uncharacterized protein LOC108666462 isoform X3 [Hyalella azteca]